MRRQARLLATTTATRCPQSPHPRARPHLPQPRTTPASQHAHTTARATQAASREIRLDHRTIVCDDEHGSKGVRRPPRLIPARFRRGGLKQQDHQHPVAPGNRPPTPSPPSVTLTPRRHHPPCRSTPWARTRIPTISHARPHPLMQSFLGVPVMVPGEPFGDDYLPRRPAASRPRSRSIPPGATWGWIRGARGCSQLPVVPADPSPATRPRLSII